MNVRTLAEKYEQYVIDCRHWIHQHPETAWKEWETMEFTSGNPEYQIVFLEDFTKYDKKDAIAAAKDIEAKLHFRSQWGSSYDPRILATPF